MYQACHNVQKGMFRGVFCSTANRRQTGERPFEKFLGANCQLESEVKKYEPTRDGAVQAWL